MLASISMDNDIKYAGSFIEQDDGPVMVALLDGTGMNALYFHLVVEGKALKRKKEAPGGCFFFCLYSSSSGVASLGSSHTCAAFT